MKKPFTIFNIVFAVLAVFATFHASAQIADLDPSYYYMLQPTRAVNMVHVALGINAAEKDNDDALLEKQAADGFSAGQLWQIIPVNDSTYRFKNKNSGMALGMTTWRGLKPDPPPNTVWNFVWNGSWHGACQRIWNADDPTQEWVPLLYDIVNDTNRYRMINMVDYPDSTICFNLWRGTGELMAGADAYQNKNIAMVDGLRIEPSSYVDVTSGYSFFFTKSLLEVPPSALNNNFVENIQVYSGNGSILIKGELYGKNVEVYSILGVRLYSAKVNASELSIPARQGLYIVKAGNMITKLVIE